MTTASPRLPAAARSATLVFACGLGALQACSDADAPSATDGPAADAGLDAAEGRDASLRDADRDGAPPSGGDADAPELDASRGRDAARDAGDGAPPPSFGVSFAAGTSQRVEAAFPPGPYQFRTVSLEGWFRLDGRSPGGTFFDLFPRGAGNTPPADVRCRLDALGEHVTCAARQPCGETCAPGTLATSAALAPVGRWFHVAWIIQRETARLYLDGTLEAQASVDYPSLPAPEAGRRIQLGGTHEPASALGAAVDEFRFSAYARYTAAFVPPAHLGFDGNTFLALHFDEGAGATSMGTTATLVDGASWVKVER